MTVEKRHEAGRLKLQLDETGQEEAR